jgi:hypothetical protein
MERSLNAGHRRQLMTRGRALVTRHGWDVTARAHLASYEALREPLDA